MTSTNYEFLTQLVRCLKLYLHTVGLKDLTIRDRKEERETIREGKCKMKRLQKRESIEEDKRQAENQRERERERQD